MRQLIDVSFKDATSYPSRVSSDVGGITIAHPWGPERTLITTGLEGFLREFPRFSGLEYSTSWLTAYRALQAGLQTLEVVRIAGESEKYQVAEIKPSSEPGVAEAFTELDEVETISPSVANFYFKHPGNPTGNGPFGLSLATQGKGDIDTLKVGIRTTGKDGIPIILEELEGSLEPLLLDGKSYFIGDVVNENSKYIKYSGPDSIKTLVTVVADEITEVGSYEKGPLTLSLLPGDELAINYDEFFGDIEVSQASILIDPGTTELGSNLIIAAADKRSDCVALVGFPTTELFTESTIKTHKQSLTPSMYAAMYAAREQFKYDGKVYQLNGIGTIAGRMAYVANNESVNQLPSAKTWGAFGSPISKALPFDNVLALHKLGINSVYSTVSGPRIFGLRSLHPRDTSYFSKFNVSRVTARILKYAFGVAMDVIHTGNTDQRKALTQNLLNADLNRLKGQGALRAESSVRCDPSNNLDIDTNGGEILNIDYECWFVKLIERVNISILATDSSVSATVTQG